MGELADKLSAAGKRGVGGARQIHGQRDARCSMHGAEAEGAQVTM